MTLYTLPHTTVFLYRPSPPPVFIKRTQARLLMRHAQMSTQTRTLPVARAIARASHSRLLFLTLLAHLACSSIHPLRSHPSPSSPNPPPSHTRPALVRCCAGSAPGKTCNSTDHHCHFDSHTCGQSITGPPVHQSFSSFVLSPAGSLGR